MKRTSVYIINFLLALLCSISAIIAQEQDTIDIPLKIKLGLEVTGPAKYFNNKDVLSTEGFFSVDLNEKRSVMLGTGYLDYSYSQYNYIYRNKGIFVRTGIDFNLLKPQKSQGKYWAGIGLHYGLSRFTSETPSIKQDNYWGTATSSIGKQTNWAHFIEATPGVRAEIFDNFSMGWTISLRLLLHSGTGSDARPIYFPGFGNGSKSIATGISYFLTWNIPYKRIKVIIVEEPPEEPEEYEETNSEGFQQIRP